MKQTEKEKAPLVSLVPHKDTSPSSVESPIERGLRLYLQTAPEDHQKVLQDKHVRAKVLSRLEEFKALIPLLERVSEVTETEAKRLGLTEAETLGDSLLKDRIISACQMAALEAENETLRLQTKTDALTGIANRRGYKEEVERAMELSARTGLPLWCFMIDIDHFHHVNNDYGHDAGDQVLKEVAERLAKQTRRSDSIARFGGEEFILISHTEGENGGIEGARVISRRLLETINSRPFVIQTNQGLKKLKITISVGGSRFYVEEAGQEKLMQGRADRSLYAAKNKGRNGAFLEGEPVENEDNEEDIRRSMIVMAEPVPESKRNLAILRSS